MLGSLSFLIIGVYMADYDTPLPVQSFSVISVYVLKVLTTVNGTQSNIKKDFFLV